MKRTDLVILGAVLALAAILLLFLRGPAGAAGWAVIYVNDVEYARLPLDEPQTLTIDQGEGKVNVVEVFEGGARMVSLVMMTVAPICSSRSRTARLTAKFSSASAGP